jgi:hypothetical protein
MVTPHHAHEDPWDECDLPHVEHAGHDHTHGDGFGHPTVAHGDHVNYFHDGHRHTAHEGHWDEH